MILLFYPVVKLTLLLLFTVAACKTMHLAS